MDAEIFWILNSNMRIAEQRTGDIKAQAPALKVGALEPVRIQRPEGTFLDARCPRPVSGCAAEVSQRIAEAVFLALVKAIPDKVAAAPAGSSGNFALGGWDPAKGAGYVMYQISGGGYGGNCDHDGLTNGCSTIGISK